MLKAVPGLFPFTSQQPGEVGSIIVYFTDAEPETQRG